MNLSNKLKKVVTEYTEAFYTIIIEGTYDEDNAYWIGGDMTGVCSIGDYFVNLSDIVLVVDNNVSGEDYIEWYSEYVGEAKNKKHVNLKSFLMNKGYKLK